jgi:hypothetical protein
VFASHHRRFESVVLTADSRQVTVLSLYTPPRFDHNPISSPSEQKTCWCGRLHKANLLTLEPSNNPHLIIISPLHLLIRTKTFHSTLRLADMSTNPADSEAMDTVVIMEEYATAQASTPADNQDAPNVPCSTFTCFPKLPIELRHKIWKYASFVTRNICVSVMRWAPFTTSMMIICWSTLTHLSTARDPLILLSYMLATNLAPKVLDITN